MPSHWSLFLAWQRRPIISSPSAPSRILLIVVLIVIIFDEWVDCCSFKSSFFNPSSSIVTESFKQNFIVALITGTFYQLFDLDSSRVESHQSIKLIELYLILIRSESSFIDQRWLVYNETISDYSCNCYNFDEVFECCSFHAEFHQPPALYQL